MTNIIPVNGTPGLVQTEGEYIAVKPLCEALGLTFSAQRIKLLGKSWATVSIIDTVGADGKRREMFSLHKDNVAMWLANIDENRVKEEARPYLIAYQKEAMKALNDYFTKGIAINERVYDYKAQAEVLMILKDALPADRVLETF